MYSEASRNESVRTILAHQEQLLLAELAAIFRAQQPDIDPTQRANRIQFLLLLVDGVACRAFSDSDLNQHEMQRVNGVLSQHLFG
jgi:hypothetical protein